MPGKAISGMSRYFPGPDDVSFCRELAPTFEAAAGLEVRFPNLSRTKPHILECCQVGLPVS